MYLGDDDLNIGTTGNAAAAYVKISLSDGTVMPRGTAFFTTWLQYSYAVRADTGALYGWANMQGGSFNVGRTPTSYTTMSYLSAIGVGQGRIYVGSSQSGVQRYRAILPSDTLGDNAQYVAGYTAWLNSPNYIFHAQSGYGRFGYDLPWGDSAAIDYYLEWEGLEP
jgi:hypothetical protein